MRQKVTYTQRNEISVNYYTIEKKSTQRILNLKPQELPGKKVTWDRFHDISLAHDSFS